jgi:hypothetical protein
MKHLTVPQLFTTLNYNVPDEATIALCKEDVEKFRLASSFLNDHFSVDSSTHVCIDFNGMSFEERFDFKVEFSHARVFRDEVYFYAQECHGTVLQWESKGVPLKYLEEIIASDITEFSLKED